MKRMNEEPVAARVVAGMDTERPTGAPSVPTESDLNYYGWRVALAACLGVMAGFGSLFVYTFSVFVKPLAAEFGWSREAISGGFAVAAVTLGLISPLLGRWIDRFGPRRMLTAALAFLAIGEALFGWGHSVGTALAGRALVGIGDGLTFLNVLRLVQNWFPAGASHCRSN